MKPFRIFLNNRNIVASSGLLLLVILSLFLSRGCGSSSEPVPPPSTPPGTFSLTGPVDALVSKSIAEGKVFLEDIETKKVLRLEWKPDANEMELPPGKYRLQTIWEQNEQESHSKSTDGAQFKFWDPEFAIQSGKPFSHGMLIQLPHSWKHPKLPAVSGATATWQGTLGKNSGAGRTTIDYKLSLTALNEVPLEECRCRWLQVVVESKSLAGPLTESAYLAIDVDAWETRKKLVVRKGWLIAHSTDIASELGVAFSRDSGDSGKPERESLKHITIEFVSDSDVLAKKAEELEAPLPENRLSVLDALTLVMDAGFQGASPEALVLRNKLSNLDILYDKEIETVGDGQLNCLAVLSRIVLDEDEVQFKLLRNDALVPFSFVKVKIEHPSLEASLNLSTMSMPAADITSAPVPEQKLAADAHETRTLPPRPRFDIATIPDQQGAMISYQGDIEIGSTLKMEYTAQISTLGTEMRDEKSFRWLKLEISSKLVGSSGSFDESAIVLIDPEDYQDKGKAVIVDGWMSYGNEHVLKFDPAGDMIQTDEDLQMLEAPLSKGRLSVHDVLALLFNVDLPHSPSRFVKLRKDVERFLKDSEGRKTTRRELAVQDRRVPGKVHEFHEGGEIDYIFERSDQVPFSFISMDLKYGQVHLFATLDSSLAVATPSPVSSEKTEWEERAEATKTRISEWQKANPNYCFWTVTTRLPNGISTEERLLAEWAGESKPQPGSLRGGKTFLKPYVGEQRDLLPGTTISKGDEDWSAEGRFWENQQGRGKYDPPRFKRRDDPDEIKLEDKAGVELTVKFKDLSDRDQDWIRQADLNWLK